MMTELWELKTEDRRLIEAALLGYGCTIDNTLHLCKGEKVLGVKVVVKGKRLRFEAAYGLIASGPISASWISSFLKEFFFWHMVAEESEGVN